MESRKTKLIETENTLVVARGEGEKLGEDSQKMQTPSYKVNKY